MSASYKYSGSPAASPAGNGSTGGLRKRRIGTPAPDGAAAGDVTARMALVPRTLEARGLDASPAVKAKLLAAGDVRGGEILDLILRDEIGHVAVGNHWYRWLCAQRGLDPLSTYAELAERHQAPRPRGPFNLAARRAAGFDEAELAALGSIAP